MNKEAIRIACAEACGWKRRKDRFGWEWTTPTGETYQPHPAKDAKHYFAPNYPEDANAALEFVKVLATKGWRCQTNNGLDTTWECIFFRPVRPSTHPDNIGEVDGEKMEMHYGAAGELPLAVTESGLKALNKWQDKEGSEK